MKKYFLLIGLVIICLIYFYFQNSEKYSIEINKKLWQKEPINSSELFDNAYLNDGNLYIHFQSAFENDISEIKINNNFYGKYDLTTEWSTGLAEVIAIPNFDSIKLVGLSINGGKEANFKIDENNQIIVRLRNDKLLIGFRKHVPYYD